MNLDYLNKKIEDSAFSKEDLSQLIGCSRTSLYNYRTGKTPIKSHILHKFILILNLDIKELFYA